MGHRLAGKDEWSPADELEGPVKLVFATGVALAAGTIGWFIGFHHANDQLPKCVEDEVLIAVEYPYTNTADLECVHIEAIQP